MATRIEPVKELFFKKDEELLIKVDGKEYRENIQTLRERKLKKHIENRISSFEKVFKKLCNEFEERFNNNEWILMRDDYCYINDIVSIIPDLNEIESPSQSSADKFSIHKADLSFGDFDEVDVPTINEAKVFLNDNIYKNSNGKIECCGENFYGITCGVDSFLITFDNVGESFRYPYSDDLDILTVPIYRFNGIDSKKISTSSVLFHWLDNNLEPKKFNSDSTKVFYKSLKKIYKMNPDWLESDGNSIVFTDKDEILDYFYKSCMSGKDEEFIPEAKEILDSNEFEADDLFLEFFEDRLLKCDDIRAKLGVLPKKTTLYGTDTGHWDLFDYMQPEDNCEYFKVKLPEDKYMTALAPDIVNSVVAIDFGTKSTVVAYEDPKHRGEIIPLRVGGYKQDSGDLYENPSCVEFCDFDSFAEDYEAKEYRPNTKVEDVAFSHDALRDFKEAGNLDSFLTDLKSWCINNEEFRFKSSKSNIKSKFLPFSEIFEKDRNPLEYYAYFLGLYINKMSGNRGVFSKYKMSFPVTIEKDIKEKIIKSFEKGIKKSFPKALLSDEKFREQIESDFIKSDLSEPAAYAITALERYYFGERLDEEDVDKLYYAVFDFGGGTTDFDFGYYSELETPNRRYDYELNRLGNAADKDLGGEKLLRYLAFELFKENKDKLKERQIQFKKYYGCSEKELFGLDDCISNDEYAELNMIKAMEKLRWVWEDPNAEEHESDKNDFSYGTCKLDLYDKHGNFVSDFALKIPQKENFDREKDDPVEFFKDLLCERIKKTIELFFESMQSSFKKADVKNIDEISIFLAGNSTKSILFNKLFEEYKETGKKAIEIKKENEQLNFVLYAPLGTEKSDDLLKELKAKYSPDDEYSGIPPTCKTGVAYGLLKSRIKVHEYSVDNKFKYYLGLEAKRKFKYVIITIHSDIDMKWKELYEVSSDETEYPFLYSSEEAAGLGNMSSNRAKPERIVINNPQDGTKIFIRATKPDEIEWKVAISENVEPIAPNLTGYFQLSE